MSDSSYQTGIEFPIQSYATIASLYLRVVILTMFSYNFLLMIEDEISYIWLKPFSFGTIFYMVGKYLTAVTVIYSSVKSGFLLMVPGFSFTGACDIPEFDIDTTAYSSGPCKLGFQLQDSGGQEYSFPFKVMFYTSATVAVCAMILLQLRTYALYNKSKRILLLFCILNVLAIIYFIVQLTLFTRLQNDPHFVDNVFGNELFGSKTNYSPLYWIPFTLNEMATFCLVVYKYWLLRRNPSISGVSKNYLPQVIVRDNMIYFSIIFIVYLSGLLLLINEEVLFALTNTHLLASVAVSGILAPNLFLSLKKSFYAQGEQGDLAIDAGIFHATARSGTLTGDNPI